MKELHKRILEISKERELTHIGSALSAVDIIEEIYEEKGPDDKFVLSAGHCFLAQLVVMEKHGIPIPDDIPTHPEDYIEGVDVPTGSLGQGLPIAVGMALADRNRNVYCLVSDGECAEGSIWESLALASELELDNLKVYVNANGFAAYKEVDLDLLEKRLKAFFPVDFRRTCSDFGDVTGLAAHYEKV